MRLIFYVIIFLFLTVSNVYSLDEKQLKIIETAFQNGFIQALMIDEDTCQKIKNNEYDLHKIIIEASDQYIKNVKNLNTKE